MPERTGRLESVVQRHLPTFAGWFGNLGWPILQKQLHTEFRRNRFFWSHLACLAGLGTTLLVILTSEGSDVDATPSQVGQAVFDGFLLVQFLVVLVVFPAFSATSFTEERARLSLDLLVITTLRPEEIVWGKFLASTIYCMLYVMAAVPLLAVTFLFGGVTVAEVLIAYSVLVGLTLLVSMASLWVSSCCRSGIRATLDVYGLVLLAVAGFWYAVWQPVQAFREENAGVTLVSATEAVWGVQPSIAWLSWALDGLDVAVLFVLLFLLTANRVRPRAEDHASKLRLLVLLWLPLRTAGAFLEAFAGPVLFGEPVGSGEREAMRGLILSAFAVLAAATLAFSMEEADISTRCRRRFGRLRGVRFPGRLLAPGPFWGTLYSVLLAVLVCGLLLGLWTATVGPDAGGETSRFVRQALLTIPVWLAGLAALGLFLSVAAFTPLYARLTLLFLGVIVFVLPLIFYVGEMEDRVWTLYWLSPATLWESLAYLDGPPGREKPVTFRIGGIHVIYIARWVLGALACILGGVAVVVARRAGLPILGFPERTGMRREGSPPVRTA